MIKNIFVNGIQVNNGHILIQKLGNISSASVDFATYQRGGASGQVLSRPLYRGMAINMQWHIQGDTLDEFIAQRDRFVGYFQNINDPDEYFKTLGIELSNGTIKNIDVLFSTISGDLSPSDIAHSIMTVTAISEKEFFVSNTEKSGMLYLLNSGGMAVPMNVPMSMSNYPSGDPIVVNNQGNSDSYPTIKIYGVFDSSFSLLNDTTGLSLSVSEELEVGDYIEIDFYNRTAVKNDNTSVLGSISGDWWTLKAGTNQVRITSGVSDDTGYAEMTYRDTYRNI